MPLDDLLQTWLGVLGLGNNVLKRGFPKSGVPFKGDIGFFRDM